ncbi:MAG: hypothetical protein IID18_07405 [Nitrospinae bacterium]|nr:hypothetical protein [Nitrospinota bacterium]
MRNEFGNHTMAFQELVLPQTKKYFKDNYLLPRLGEGATYGFDVRYIVSDDFNVRRFQTDLFLALQPLKPLTYQVRLSGGGITEQYAMLKLSRDRFFIKAGTFHPTFGLHNSDYDSFNMVRTGNFASTFLDGVAFGADLQSFSIVFEAFNPDRRGVYGLHLYRTSRMGPFGLMGGASLRFSEYYTYRGGNGSFPHAKAIFGGINYDRFTFEGELDLAGRGNDTLIVYANFTTRIEYGFYFIAEYNFFDGNRDFSDGVDEFLRFSIELFPIPYVEFRPSFTRYTRGFRSGENDFFVQFHLGY